MADEQIITSIVAKSDFSNLIVDVQKLTGSLSKLQQEVAGSNRALAGQIAATNAMFKDTLQKTGQFSSHFVSLTSDVEKFGRNLDSGRLKLRDYFRVYQDHVRTHGGLVRDLAKQQVQLQNAVLQPLGRNAQGLMQYNVHIPRGLDLTKNKTSLLKQELQIMNKVIQDGGVQLINWGKNTQWAGRQLTVGLTLPLVAFGKAAADAFKVADQELTRLTKVYGDIAGTSSAELSKIRQEVSATAKELSAAMGVNFAETISLAADIAATGKTGNELLSSVSETTRLAVLGEVDRQEAMKATLAIQSAFKQNTEELSQSINFLNAVENQTSTTLNDLVEAIPKAGPVIKGLGGSVQDLALYLTAMREGGINASEGANALKSALASLINPTNVAVEKFQGFGIDLLGIVNKNAGNVTETLFALQAALDKLNPLQKQQAIEQLFGKFQFSRLNALFENLGRQGSQTLQVLDLMKASTGELAAVADRELAAVTESASGKFKRAVESLKADMAGAGERFLNIGTKLINILDKIIQFASKLPEPVKNILAFGGAFTAILGPVIMLTGVLANFFGYIIKGLGHFKALFKGAEGFKLLTPEILAAQHAGSLLSDEFYNDALAADTLRLAIKKLSEDLIGLQANATNARTATVGLGQVITTAAGTPVGVMGGGRGVDINNPLLGPRSRAAAHLNPRNPKDPSTIFGLTLQPIPVNRRIGANPQILMNDRLDDIEGLTTIGGVSTGVVAGEHARYQALMATLGLQSRQEIEALKKTIKMGGSVSQEFIATFDDILPITQRLSQNAATQSAAIVAELRAGKINVEQARAAIIAANAQLERDLGIAVTQYGATVGRTIDLTKTPLIDQPVVDATGKPNTRGMYRKGIFRKVMDAVGRATRTKTLGGPYSIETTKPQGLNAGGQVYMSSGAIVPGPNINADVVPAMLTPGEFVVNREATAANLPLLQAINGNGSNGPGYNDGSNGSIRSTQYESVVEPRLTGVTPEEMSRLAPGRFRGSRSSYRIRGTAGVYLNTITDPAIISKYPYLSTDGRTISIETLNSRLASGGLHHEVYEAAMAASRSQYAGSSDQLLRALAQNGIINENEASAISRDIDSEFRRDLRRQVGVRDANNRYWSISNRIINRALANNSRALGFWNEFSSQPGYIVSESLRSSGEPMRSPSMELRKLTHNGETINMSPLRGRRGESFFAHSKTPTPLLNRLMNLGITTVGRRAMPFRFSRNIRMNRGGMVPGYNRGGKIPGYMGGGLVSQMLLSSLGFMGGQAIGGQFGQTGSMMGGMLGSMAPMMMMGRGSGSDISALYDKSALSGTKLGQSMAGQAMQGGKLSSTFARLALSLTKLNLAIGVTTAILGAGWIAWRRYQENQERVANSFGMSAEQAQKAGLKYTDYTKKLKDAMQAHKDMLERNKLVYESMTKANTPLNITIEQYKKLKKEVKQTMPDIVENLNKMSRTDAVKYAVQLKTQFVSMGMSVEEATKKVYALFSVSNKSSMSGIVIGQKAFVKIKDSITAATSAIELYNDAVKRANAKGQANAVNTAFTAIDSAIQNAIKEAGTDKSGANKLSYYKAMEQTLDSINAKGSKQTRLTQDTIDAIRDQNFELGNVLRKSDTIVSAWAKYQILLSGINLDVSKLNAQQAITVNNAIQLVTETVGKSLTGTGGILNDENKRLKSLQSQYSALEKAAKGASVKEQINARDRIRALQDEINLIKKKADEKKKALREEQADENVSLQIQQKQLEYQDMLATGNLSGAAQLQLEIERLTKEQQLILTERAIDADTERRVAPLEAQKTALERAQEKQADAASLAADKLGVLSKEIEKLKTKMSEVNNAILTITLGKLFGGEDWINSPEGKAATAYLNKILKKTGNVPVTQAGDSTATSPDEAKKTAEAEQKKNQPATSPEEAKKAYDEKNKKPDPSQQGKEWYDAIAGAIEKGLNKNELVMSAKTVVINADAVVQGDKPNVISQGTLKSILGEDGTYIPPAVGNELKSKSLSKSAIRSIVNERGFEAGDRFTYNDVVYEVTRGKSAFLDPRAKIVQKAEGGLLKGPGTGRSDSILGMYANGGMVRVSNGEYIINADTVKNLGVPFFDAINGMKNGGLMVNYNVPKYADAGPLIEAMAYRPPMASNNSAYNINVTLNGTNLSPDDVAKAISREMKMREAMSGRNRTIGG